MSHRFTSQFYVRLLSQHTHTPENNQDKSSTSGTWHFTQKTEILNMLLASIAPVPANFPALDDSPHNADIVCPNKIGPYFLRDRMGQGGFAIVRMAIHEDTQNVYACKVVPKKRLVYFGIEDQFHREIDILCALRHPGICPLVDCLFDSINCYLIMELCPGGNLRRRIIEMHLIPEPDAKETFRQIIEALGYVHSQGIAHRDIKPENILISHDGHVRLIDFGLSAYQSAGTLLSSQVGSPMYISPETALGKHYDGFKSDIWSCGVLLYTMLRGQPPWTVQNMKLLIDQISRADYYLPDSISSDAKDLLRRILKPNPDERLTITEIISHPWLRETSVASHCEIPVNRRWSLGSDRPKILTPNIAAALIARSKTCTRSHGLGDMTGIIRMSKPHLLPPPLIV
jgi:serine/threonine protein kinase